MPYLWSQPGALPLAFTFRPFGAVEQCASLRGQRPATQNLRHAPGLRDTAARVEGRDGVEDFADRADARFVQMREEAFEEAARARAVFRVDFEPRVHERADEPAPDRPLMIGRVARLQVAVVGRLKVWMVGRERAQPRRRQKLLPHHLDDRLPPFAL